MNTSLRDQLLAAGLVSQKQARQAAQQEQQRQFRNKGRPDATQAGDARSTAGAAHAPSAKAARDQELNRRQQDKAQRKARLAQIEQMVEQNRLPRLETDDYYSFIDGRKIRRVAVDSSRRDQLMRGELVLVRYRGHYAVVPHATAEKIREREEHMVIACPQPSAGTEQNDAYKDFVVPDDLMW